MAIGIVAVMPVKAKKGAEFVAGFKELAEHVGMEPGNRLYQLFESRDGG
jgi:quinol monooxygenase YgiN